jgi:tetratricopeptide (TPR) repeat protein
MSAGSAGGVLIAAAFVAAFTAVLAVAQEAPISALRERGAALFEERRWDEAEKVLRDVTARKEAVARDFTNVACVLLSREVDPFFRRDPDPKTAPEIDRWCAEAIQRDANDAAAQYLAGVAWWAQAVPVDPKRALPFLERAAQLAPDDAFVHYHLGMLFEWVEEPDKALPHFEKVAALGFEFAGVAYSPSIYRLGNLLRRRKLGDDVERGMRLIKESDKLRPAKDARTLAAERSAALIHDFEKNGGVNQDSLTAAAYSPKQPATGLLIKDRKTVIIVESPPAVLFTTKQEGAPQAAVKPATDARSAMTMSALRPAQTQPRPIPILPARPKAQ